MSHAWPRLDALRRTVQRYDRLRHQHWRWLGALSLSATYGVLVLLASLCVATGLLHMQEPHAVPHHHAGSAAHRHGPPDARQASPVPDLCDLVHQVCTALILWSVPLPTLTLSPSPLAVQWVHSFLHALTPSPLSIRAPPALFS